MKRGGMQADSAANADTEAGKYRDWDQIWLQSNNLSAVALWQRPLRRYFSFNPLAIDTPDGHHLGKVGELSAYRGAREMGLIETAASILSTSERRLEVIAQNISNISTVGYQRYISFQSIIGAGNSFDAPQIGTIVDNRRGPMVSTEGPLDLALGSAGVFLVRDNDRLVASRGGTFHRDGEGYIADNLGRRLQQSGGGDLVVAAGSPVIGSDGIVAIEGQPVGRIGVFAQAPATSTINAAQAGFDEIDDPQVRQGMVEQSNVVTGDEMMSMLALSRSSEVGARLVQTYDDLMGRALTTFASAAR